MVVHGFDELLNALGPVNSGLEATLTGIELIIDYTNGLLTLVASVDSLAGAAGIAAKLFVAGGALANEVYVAQNLKTDADNEVYEMNNCSDLTGSCRTP